MQYIYGKLNILMQYTNGKLDFEQYVEDNKMFDFSFKQFEV